MEKKLKDNANQLGVNGNQELMIQLPWWSSSAEIQATRSCSPPLVVIFERLEKSS